MSGPDAPSEDESDRDGFLSYSAEWHSLSHGLYDGLRSIKTMPTNSDVQKEPHYYKGAYVVGTLLQALLVGLAAVVGSGVV
jgi:hypothetical protein